MSPLITTLSFYLLNLTIFYSIFISYKCIFKLVFSFQSVEILVIFSETSAKLLLVKGMREIKL